MSKGSFIRATRPGLLRTVVEQSRVGATGVRSVRQVAEILGCTPQNVSIIEGRALKMMRRAWIRMEMGLL